MRCRDARRFVCDIIRQKQCCHVLYRAGLPVCCSMYECMPIYVGLLFEVNSGGAGTCVLTHATMTHPCFFYFLHTPTHLSCHLPRAKKLAWSLANYTTPPWTRDTAVVSRLIYRYCVEDGRVGQSIDNYCEQQYFYCARIYIHASRTYVHISELTRCHTYWME